MRNIVDILSQRLQHQERLTSQIADTLLEASDPLGIGVIVEGEHLCMSIRGIKKPGSQIMTSGMRGVLRKDATARAEVLALMGKSERV